MTVTELLGLILSVYPGATPEAMKGIKSAFYARLQRHEGANLQSAYDIVVGTFKPTTRQPFPIPGDFEKHLPETGLHLPGDAGPALDFKARNERALRLFTEWRAGQGMRGSNGVPQVLIALEAIARPLAFVEGWKENPRPLVLRAKDLKLAQHRAISIERRLRWGSPGRKADLWWEQISSIAEQWRIQTTREEWEENTNRATRAAA